MVLLVILSLMQLDVSVVVDTLGRECLVLVLQCVKTVHMSNVVDMATHRVFVALCRSTHTYKIVPVLKIKFYTRALWPLL